MPDRQDIDALIVGALYGEIDAAERARLDAHLSSHPEDREALAALERTRAQVRRGLADLPQAEPSPNISAVLLAAARGAATSPVRDTGRARSAVAAEPPSQGLWSRFVEWMRPIAGHPAFAAAAVLVLVAGTATALWLRGGRSAEPQVSRRSEDRAAAAAPAAEAAAPRAEKAEEVGVAGAATGSGSAADGYRADLADHDVAPPAPPADDRRKGAEGAKPGHATFDTAEAKKAGGGGRDMVAMDKDQRPARGHASPSKPTAEPGMMEVQTAGDDITIKELDEQAGAASSDDGLAKNARKGDRDATANAVSGAGGAVSPAPEPRAVDPAVEEWARGAHAKLAKLVEQGKCPEAGRLGADIKEKAPDYYAANVANDRAVRACKSYIEAQAKKRATSAQQADR